MADKLDVEVHGYPELARDTGRLANGIEEEAGEQFGRVADGVAASSRMRVPRVSGTLASTVVSEQEGGEALVGMGGAAAPYAGWVEFGGSRGRPYIGSGRYLYPTAIAVEPALIVAANKAALTEIGGMRWSNPAGLS